MHPGVDGALRDRTANTGSPVRQRTPVRQTRPLPAVPARLGRQRLGRAAAAATSDPLDRCRPICFPVRVNIPARRERGNAPARHAAATARKGVIGFQWQSGKFGTMDQASVRQEITGIFEDVMDLEDVTLEDDTTANDIEEWDSLSHIRLIIAIERHFGIKFTNAEIENLKKFGDLVALVGRKKAA